MNKIIYLHIGVHKTGTTSIQESLDLNKRKLLKNGIYFPVIIKNRIRNPKNWVINHGVALYCMFSDYPENYLLKPISKVTIFNKKNKLNLIKELNKFNKSSAHSMILSGEDISLLSENNLKVLRSFLLTEIPKGDIRIIISFREPIKIFTSHFQQNIKSGQSVINQELNQFDNFYFKRVSKFINVFGKENIITYKFEDATNYPSGLIGYFLEIVGVNKLYIKKFKKIRKNESLSDISVDIISYINEKAPYPTHLLKDRFFRDTFLLENLLGNKFALDRRLIDFYTINNKKDINWLADTFNIKYKKLNEFNQEKLQFSEDFFSNIKKIYLFLTPLIKELLLDYVLLNQEKMENQEMCSQMIIWIKKKKSNPIIKINIQIYRYSYFVIQKMKGY